MTALLERRFRGFRIVNLICGALLLSVVMGVYLVKIFGGDQKAQIAAAESQIDDEQGRIKLLGAEVAYLGRPERIEDLAQIKLGMAPAAAARRISLDDLARLAAPGAPPAAQVTQP